MYYVSMSRPLRIEFPGAFYHVIQRGIERRKIFHYDKDYERFLTYLSLAHRSYGIHIHTYCLMPNHYHLIIETPKANLKEAMHMINTAYSVYYNKKNRRIGPLYQGRYKSPLIEADEYVQHVSRYIHLNPVKAKIAETPEGYKWSSYRILIGREKAPEWFKKEFILGMFGRKTGEAQKEYEQFVKDEVMDSKGIIDENNIMGVVIGGRDFFEEIKKKYVDERDDEEIPKINEIKMAHDAEKVEMIKEECEKVFKSEKERKKAEIYLIRRNTGYSLKEISGLVGGGITYSGISQVCRRVERGLKKDARLREEIDKLNKKMSNVKT